MSENAKSKKRLTVKMGYSIEDANQGWYFDTVQDTGAFGKVKCNMGHALRYAFIVKNPQTKEEHIYGSECITKFWINSFYKGIESSKFEELYTKYQPLFIKFAKNLYQADKYGWQLPDVFPQNFEDLEKITIELAVKVKEEIKRRRALFKQYDKEHEIAKRKRDLRKKCPAFKTLLENRNNLQRLQNNNFLYNIAFDFIRKYEKYGSMIKGGLITDKQIEIVKRIADILTGKNGNNGNIHQNIPRNTNVKGNPELARKIGLLIPTIKNPWLRNEFLPSVIKQLEYKNDLSDKQWEVLKRNKIDVDLLLNNHKDNISYDDDTIGFEV